jgi:hypothetical protein
MQAPAKLFEQQVLACIAWDASTCWSFLNSRCFHREAWDARATLFEQQVLSCARADATSTCCVCKTSGCFHPHLGMQAPAVVFVRQQVLSSARIRSF